MEEWRNIPIEGLEHFQASSMGRVRNSKTGNVLTPETKNRRTPTITLKSNGVKTHYTVCRLIGMCFIEGYNEKSVIKYIDGNSHNCSVENLTIDENYVYIDTHRFKDRVGEKYGMFEVIANTGRLQDRYPIWLCKCSCGNTFEVSSKRINHRINCGCTKIRKNVDENNGRYTGGDYKGALIREIQVIERCEDKESGYIRWKCRCLLCGKEHLYDSWQIKGNHLRCDCEQWWEKHGKHLGKKRLPNQQASLNAYYGQYRKGARERNIDFDLTIEEFKEIIKQDCCYCGAKPRNRQRLRYNKEEEFLANGIDRKDSDKGYNVENCVPCCTQCNMSKNTLKVEEFKNWIKRAYEYMYA